jgi:ATP-dependent DNA helicase RecG
MTATFDNLRLWMESREDEHLEFKEAKNHFDFEELVKYCVALANEQGGRIIFGITDKFPRTIVGTKAFDNLENTKSGITERLHLRIDADSVDHPDGRVVIFHVPARPLGIPIAYKGSYWMRSGGSLVPMTPDLIKRIFDEATPDFSAEVCKEASLSDLNAASIEEFRARWMRKSGNTRLAALSPQELLNDAELILGDKVTYAALVLLGSHQALGRFLANAEVVFEYRSAELASAALQRKEYRQAFFSFYDDLWTTINLRNETQHFRDGLFILDIPTFNEAAIREAILNSISHRDYRLPGSVFVRQYPRKLEIVSPGGFPPGITPENILWRQLPRNRRIAEALAKCGLVERSGQGADRMFEECIREGKSRPDFSDTDDYQVSVSLKCEVQDPQFARFLEKASHEKQFFFSTRDLLVLDSLHNEAKIPEDLRQRLATLSDHGIIERIGRGRGTRYILSRHFYGFIGKRGIYTRKRGLDRETNKSLLLKHIESSGKNGSALGELLQVLPSLSTMQVRTLLRELNRDGKAHSVGKTRAGRWYLGPRLSESSDPIRSD